MHTASLYPNMFSLVQGKGFQFSGSSSDNAPPPSPISDQEASPGTTPHVRMSQVRKVGLDQHIYSFTSEFQFNPDALQRWNWYFVRKRKQQA